MDRLPQRRGCVLHCPAAEAARGRQAEGQFSPDTTLEVRSSQAAPPQNREVYGQWTVSLSDEDASFTALRLKLPEDVKRGAVWLLTEEGSWEQLPADSASSYVRAELEGTSAVLCLTKAPLNPLLPILIAAGLAVPDQGPSESSPANPDRCRSGPGPAGGPLPAQTPPEKSRQTLRIFRGTFTKHPCKSSASIVKYGEKF